MSARAPVDDLDGIVVIELSLDEHHEIEAVVGLLRAGALALQAAPVARTAVVEQGSRRRFVEHGLRVAQEIQDEAIAVAARRAAAYKARDKADRKAQRARERAR